MSSDAGLAPVGRMDGETEMERRADLARMKRRATALVLVAATWLVLVVTTDDVRVLPAA